MNKPIKKLTPEMEKMVEFIIRDLSSRRLYDPCLFDDEINEEIEEMIGRAMQAVRKEALEDAQKAFTKLPAGLEDGITEHSYVDTCHVYRMFAKLKKLPLK